MTDKPITKIEIYYSREWKSWGVLKYNDEGDQIGNGIWVHSKKEALIEKKELEQKYGILKRRKIK